MGATLEDFTFGTLRDSLRTEFGGSTALDTEIGRKLNDALALIWQEQKCWKWSLKAVTITSYPSITRTTTTAITVSPPTTLVTLAPADTASVLMRYQMTLPSDPNEYLVSANAVGVTQIVGLSFLHAQGIGVTATLKQAWLELPADFAYMHTLRTESGTMAGREPMFVEPWVLEKVRKGLLAPGPSYMGGGFYTIAQDPLPYATTGWQPNRQYISFWPAPTALTKWDGYYYAVPKDMTADADIYEVPRGFRRRLFYKAAELLAAKLRDFEAVQYYAQQGAIGAELMVNANSFADDTDQPLRMQPFSFSQLIQGGVVQVP